MESLLFACVILKHIQVHVNRSLKILNSTKATVEKKKAQKRDGGQGVFKRQRDRVYTVWVTASRQAG